MEGSTTLTVIGLVTGLLGGIFGTTYGYLKDVTLIEYRQEVQAGTGGSILRTTVSNNSLTRGITNGSFSLFCPGQTPTGCMVATDKETNRVFTLAIDDPPWQSSATENTDAASAFNASFDLPAGAQMAFVSGLSSKDVVPFPLFLFPSGTTGQLVVTSGFDIIAVLIDHFYQALLALFGVGALFVLGAVVWLLGHREPKPAGGTK